MHHIIGTSNLQTHPNLRFLILYPIISQYLPERDPQEMVDLVPNNLLPIRHCYVPIFSVSQLTFSQLNSVATSQDENLVTSKLQAPPETVQLPENVPENVRQ